jgi:hypothetical protein
MKLCGKILEIFLSFVEVENLTAQMREYSLFLFLNNKTKKFGYF